ncbi:hypothetical protein [Sphingobacterium prati]|uniref:hypothetical protein n=1 Tax=Sphingobacterium prati TaxID=2737006 RepID=UPI0015531B2C|nr:hypothetical protein [Sphingobacterium prati]NPE46338.1 hypothetical protein [Sphingobacterium prati]
MLTQCSPSYLSRNFLKQDSYIKIGEEPLLFTDYTYSYLGDLTPEMFIEKPVKTVEFSTLEYS